MKRLTILTTLLALSATSVQACEASWYGSEMHGRTWAGRWNPNGMTFAHRTFPMGSKHTICYNGRCVRGTVTDRGPAAYTGRCIDLSQGMAKAIGLIRAGHGNVTFD